MAPNRIFRRTPFERDSLPLDSASVRPISDIRCRTGLTPFVSSRASAARTNIASFTGTSLPSQSCSARRGERQVVSPLLKTRCDRAEAIQPHRGKGHCDEDHATPSDRFHPG